MYMFMIIQSVCSLGNSPGHYIVPPVVYKYKRSAAIYEASR